MYPLSIGSFALPDYISQIDFGDYISCHYIITTNNFILNWRVLDFFWQATYNLM